MGWNDGDWGWIIGAKYGWEQIREITDIGGMFGATCRWETAFKQK